MGRLLGLRNGYYGAAYTAQGSQVIGMLKTEYETMKLE